VSDRGARIETLPATGDGTYNCVAP